MPRYIDADKAIDNIEETTWYHIGSLGNLVKGANSETDIPLYKAEDIHKAITETPTADVVEVVRCKDCVNRVEFDTNKFHCGLTGYYCGETGYCSDAVRKPKKGGEG